MSVITDHILTLLVFIPTAGALLLMTFPRENTGGHRSFAFFICAVELILGLFLLGRIDFSTAQLQFVEQYSWIPSMGISYSLGIDGLSLSLILLTLILMPLIVISTFTAVKKQIREYLIAMLLLETAMFGALLATDLFLFYIFWELMLIPMYFLIGIWGGKRKIYAAIKFFLYTMFGSMFMLVAIIFLYLSIENQGPTSFTISSIMQSFSDNPLPLQTQYWLFLAFAIAFAIKVPIFPFHTWLPDAHTEAPTGGSVILAAVLLKMGIYGFLRFAIPFFPEAAYSFMPLLGLLGVIGIIYGALLAMAQTDVKRLVAYSSISHLGFVVLGMSALTIEGLTGSMYQMLNHGISTGALFFLVGVIYERRHTREMTEFGGLAKRMPVYAATFVIISLSSIGVPGLNGFVGEFLILIGTYTSSVQSFTTTHSDIVWLMRIAFMLISLIVLIILLAQTWKAVRAEKMSARFGLLAIILIAIASWLILVGKPLLPYSLAMVIFPAPSHATLPYEHLFSLLAIIGASGVILAAVYLLTLVQKMFFGPLNKEENKSLPDLSLKEKLILFPLVVMAFVMGVYPQPFLGMLEANAATITNAMAQYSVPQQTITPPQIHDQSDASTDISPREPSQE